LRKKARQHLNVYMNLRSIGCSAACLFCVAAAQAQRPDRPNFIVILADDLGWQDLKCYDKEAPFSVFQTPYIDALASEGVLFRQAYSPSPVCAPSRVGIICGKHPARAGKTSVVGGTYPQPGSSSSRMMEPYYTARMALDEITIPEALKKLNYFSGHMGKWHMAVGHNSYPNALDQGFDWSRANRGVTVGMSDRKTGFATTNTGDPYQLQNINGQPSAQGFAFDRLTQDAIDFLGEATTAHASQPFFVYYASWLVHAPIHMRTERLLQKYAGLMGYNYPLTGAEFFAPGQKNPYYAAMVETFDYHVHRIVTYLKNTDDPRWPGHKLIENTYIFLTSDNGGTRGADRENVTDNFPLDQGKTRTEEGGTRVPFIVTGPGVRAGVSSEVMVNGLDLYPTILALAGQPVPERLDGCDLRGLLLGNPQDPALIKDRSGAVRDTMFWHFPHYGVPSSTIRKGGWKLLRNHDHVNNSVVVPFRLHRLYDTNGAEMDIGETNNLASAQPAMQAQLATELQAWLTEVGARLPSYNPKLTALPHQSEVPAVTGSGNINGIAWVDWQTNKAPVKRVELIYTPSGGSIDEEWFCLPVAIAAADGHAEIAIPKGTTHFVFNLIDANNFLVSSPDVGTGNIPISVPLYVPNLRDFYGEWRTAQGLDALPPLNTEPELNTVGTNASDRLLRDAAGFWRARTSAWTVSRGILGNANMTNNTVAEGALACMVDLSNFSDPNASQITLSFEYTTADAAEKLYVHLWGYRDVGSTGATPTVNLGAQNGNAWEIAGGVLQAFNLGKTNGVFSGSRGSASDAAAILTGSTGAQVFSHTFDLSGFTTAPNRVAGYDYLVLGFAREIGSAGSPAVTIQNVVVSAGGGVPLLSFVRELDADDPLADPDGDGRNNFKEYALGGNPRSGVDAGVFPAWSNGGTQGGQWLEHVYSRRRDAAVRGLSYQVEHTNDLSVPGWSTQGVTETRVAPVDTEFEAVTNRIPVTGRAGFLRLNISSNR
jgi:arylsulfatase A-like enzyme